MIIVERNGELVAWGQVMGDGADADVHPDHRGQGIGRAPVEWTERRASEAAGDSSETRIGQTLIAALPGTEERCAAGRGLTPR